MARQATSLVGDEQTDVMRLDAIWREITQCLEARKARIVDEIGQYPSPIPACDAQFNGLLEERAAILRELGEVQSLFRQPGTIDERATRLNDFILSSRFVDSEIRGKALQLGGRRP